MEFVPFSTTAMIEVLMRLDSQQLETSYYAGKGSAWDLTSLETLADAVLTWVEAGPFAVLSNMLTCVGVKTTSLESNTAPTFTAVPDHVVQGAVAQPSEPNSVAF